MKKLFNDYVQSLETYIMFQIKQETLKLTPELIKKGRKPISLSMGAPVKVPPAFVTEKLIEAIKEDGTAHASASIISLSTPISETMVSNRLISSPSLSYATLEITDVS